jgi:choline dehydrogenase-like flavoprotein
LRQRRRITRFHPPPQIDGLSSRRTCRAGQDQKAVVDERPRVGGFAGLRVVGAQIMRPSLFGNTNAATSMISDSGIEMILEDSKATTC